MNQRELLLGPGDLFELPQQIIRRHNLSDVKSPVHYVSDKKLYQIVFDFQLQFMLGFLLGQMIKHLADDRILGPPGHPGI